MADCGCECPNHPDRRCDCICVQHDEDNCSCQHAEGRYPTVKRLSPDCPRHGGYFVGDGAG